MQPLGWKPIRSHHFQILKKLNMISLIISLNLLNSRVLSDMVRLLRKVPFSQSSFGSLFRNDLKILTEITLNSSWNSFQRKISNVVMNGLICCLSFIVIILHLVCVLCCVVCIFTLNLCMHKSPTRDGALGYKCCGMWHWSKLHTCADKNKH